MYAADEMRARGDAWRCDMHWMQLLKWAHKVDEQFRQFMRLSDELKEFKGWRKLMNGKLEKRDEDLIKVWSDVVGDAANTLDSEKANFAERLADIVSLSKRLRECSEVCQTFLNDWQDWDESDRRTRWANCPRCLPVHTFKADVVRYEEMKADIAAKRAATMHLQPVGDIPHVGW